VAGTPYIKGISEHPHNLMYNYVVRQSRPGEIPRYTPFNPETDELEFGKTYIERTDHPVTMTAVYDEGTIEVRYGYYFRGDNGVSYRKDGRTGYGEILAAGVNDIVGIVVE